MTPSASDVIASLIDPGTFTAWDGPLQRARRDVEYASQLRRAAAKAGTDESVITGRAHIDGMSAALVVSEFAFLAGSVGHDAATRIIAAYERATDEGLPVVAAPVSGGTRMQEGAPAFLRMAGIAAAAAAHRAAGLPSLALLRGPTTGGVFATWGSLGQVTAAQPGALLGFLGPRVYQEVMGRPFPSDVQTAENLCAHGIIDVVAETGQWRGLAARFLAVAAARPGEAPPWAPRRAPAAAIGRRELLHVQTPPHPDPDAWTHVTATRAPDRPSAADLLERCATHMVPLHGTGAGEPAPGLALALALIHGRGAVVVAQDRAAQARGELIGPGSLRAARRGMTLAAELGLPLVTIIDTPGAELSKAAEEGAIAGEIARCLADLSRLRVATVSVLLGQGTGGGAIALLPCDWVIAAEHAWVTPLPPEGAAAIVHRDAGRAPQMAAEQRITAAALADYGAVDAVVAEQGDWLAAIGEHIAGKLDDLARHVQPTGCAVQATDALLASRRQRWRG